MRRRASDLYRAGVSIALPVLLSFGCAGSGRLVEPQAPRQEEPDPEVRPPIVEEVASRHGMVATSSPEAARVGAAALAEGGNAVDAAVAALLTLYVSEPAAAGLGGEAVILVSTADGRREVIDTPSFVPSAVRPERLREMQETETLWGPELTTVPTALATVATALERHGTWSLQRALAPAIRVAERGFVLGRYQRAIVDEKREGLLKSAGLSRLFFTDEGLRRPVGSRIRQPELAGTLRRLAVAGWRDFYEGRISERIAEDMSARGGWITRADLARVPKLVRASPPVNATYRGYTVLAPGEPWGGGILRDVLAIVDGFPAELAASGTVDRLHLFIEACRIAQFARRENVSNQPPTVAPPAVRDMRRRVVLERARMIRFDRKIDRVLLGSRTGFVPNNTTQVSVMDAAGGAVSLTSSTGSYFGSKMVTPVLGFTYNSLLEVVRPEAARPGARFPGSMTPTMVLDEGRPILLAGTGGSDRIPNVLMLLLSNVIDRGMSVARAVAAPRGVWTGPHQRELYIEVRPPISEGWVDALENRGFTGVTAIHYPTTIKMRAKVGGVHCVAYDEERDVFVGVGDTRRGGVAVAPGGA